MLRRRKLNTRKSFDGEHLVYARMHSLCQGEKIKRAKIKNTKISQSEKFLTYGICIYTVNTLNLAWYPGVPIWREGKEEHLVHTVVYMHIVPTDYFAKGWFVLMM